MNKFLVKLLCSFLTLLPVCSYAAPIKLIGHYRSRPPFMVVENQIFQGPLKDIIDEACAKTGCTIDWQSVPLKRSIDALANSTVDIVPRFCLTKDRSYVTCLGPVGFAKNDVKFLVPKGQENLINQYEDLKKLTIGIKDKTFYFKRFNDDDSLTKVPSLDDANMAKMLAANRFQTMIVLGLDQAPIEAELDKIDFKDYTYASYVFHQTSGIYYGANKDPAKKELFDNLNHELKNMMDSGRVDAIYKTYDLSPPLRE